MNQPLRVAYQGERGAFSESAVSRLTTAEVQSLPFASFEEMFASVRSGDAHCCVTPIENSLAGSIHRNYDLLLESQLMIRGETSLRISHDLLAPQGASISSLRRVYSHPVALAQCGRYLRAHPEIEAVPVHDTAGAVRLVVERGRTDEAAIASQRAGQIYEAITLASAIEDDPRNFTRFFLASPPELRIESPVDRQDARWKTSLLLRIGNRPGSLFRALGVFALQEIDLSKIESRPIEGRPWEYAFYIDVIGNAAEAPLSQALDSLRASADEVTLLGSYRTRW